MKTMKITEQNVEERCHVFLEEPSRPGAEQRPPRWRCNECGALIERLPCDHDCTRINGGER